MSDLNIELNQMAEEAIILKAKEIVARRFFRSTQLCFGDKVENYFMMQLADKEHEVFCVAFLNSQCYLIDCLELFSGTVNETCVYAREVVKSALQHNAVSVILAHNHPSGNVEPTKEDKILTQRLKEALALVDIEVVDHIIVSGAKSFSFARRGLL